MPRPSNTYLSARTERWSAGFIANPELFPDAWSASWSAAATCAGSRARRCPATATTLCESGHQPRNSSDFQPVAAIAGSWVALDAGRSTCAIATDGTLSCWGIEFMLGSGFLLDFASSTPLAHTGLWHSVSVGMEHACAVGTDGTGACWGISTSGQLGDGRGGSDRPVRVAPP